MALQRLAGNSAVCSLLASSRPSTGPSATLPLQRLVQWVDGQRPKTRDLTRSVTDFEDFGVTPPMVNGVVVDDQNKEQVVHGPVFSVGPDGGGGVRLRVGRESINRVGYRMELPTSPPWKASVPGPVAGNIEMLGNLGFALDDFKQRAAFDLTVKGRPSDSKFAAGVEVHEDVHVEDHRGAFNDILGPWDQMIATAKGMSATFTGADRSAAEKAFYASMGGTPAEIGKRLKKETDDLGAKFHATPGGRQANLEETEPNKKRDAITVYFRHPKG